MIKLSKDEIIETLEQCLLNVSCPREQVGCYLADQHDCQEQLFNNVVAMLKEQDDKIRQLQLALDIMKGNGILVKDNS